MFRMFLTLTVIALGIAFLTRPDADKTRDLFRAKVQEHICHAGRQWHPQTGRKRRACDL